MLGTIAIIYQMVMLFAFLHKIKRKIGVSRSVGFGILFFSFFKVIVFVCCSLLLKLIGIHSIISDTDTDDLDK